MNRVVSSFLAVCGLCGAFASHGAAISSADALTAARNWLNGEAMIAEGLSSEPEAVRTEDDGSGVVYHVVSLAGGGFVVLSADDGIEPVIAFSAKGTFPEAASGEPVRALIMRDLSERTGALSASGGTFKRRAYAAGGNAAASPEEKWARLLAVQAANVKSRAYSNGRASVSDLRVEPLVKSQWGQKNDSGYSNKGSACYNLYTPNQCPCGCVATAMAQIMRYWEWPSSVKSFSRTCGVNGAATTLSVAAGAYSWCNMPLNPANGTTEAQRQAIGKLTYDCGVSMCTVYYGTQGAGAIGSFAFKPLMEDFSYANAKTYCADRISTADIEQSVYPSLDAGCPVMMGFSDGGYDQHEVVADGYGFISSTPYVHLNVGWTATSGSDLWYNLPQVTLSTGSSSSSYSAVDHIIYNVFPDETGDVLSGRVTDEDGEPAEGVEVKVCKSGGASALATVKTSKYGIYAFVLPGGAKYDVTAGGATRAGIFLKKSANPSSVNLETGGYVPGSMAVGNSWGNNFVLGETPEPEPEPSEEPSVAVSCGLDGAELALGQSVTYPVEIECAACKVKSLKAAGLPSGLKLVSGKKAAPYDYIIAGTPKKASDKPFTVKLTVQAKADDAKVKVPNTVAEYEVFVLPLKDWAVGTFSGMAEVGGTAAAFTMTVKNTGAISGKVTVGKKGYAFKANGFAAMSEDGYRVEVEPAKLGEALAFDLRPRAFGDDEIGAITNGCVQAAQEIWKQKEYKKFLTKYTSPDKSISWTAAGKATWTTTTESGKKAKLTATLLPVSCEDGVVSLCAYFVADGTATRMDVRYAEDSPQDPDIQLVRE